MEKSQGLLFKTPNQAKNCKSVKDELQVSFIYVIIKSLNAN